MTTAANPHHVLPPRTRQHNSSFRSLWRGCFSPKQQSPIGESEALARRIATCRYQEVPSTYANRELPTRASEAIATRALPDISRQIRDTNYSFPSHSSQTVPTTAVEEDPWWERLLAKSRAAVLTKQRRSEQGKSDLKISWVLKADPLITTTLFASPSLQRPPGTQPFEPCEQISGCRIPTHHRNEHVGLGERSQSRGQRKKRRKGRRDLRNRLSPARRRWRQIKGLFSSGESFFSRIFFDEILLK